MSDKEIELLKLVERHYSNLKKVSDYHFEDRGGVLVKLPPNRDSFVTSFYKLFDAIVDLNKLNVDYLDMQGLCTLKSKEVHSLEIIKYSDSRIIEGRNFEQAKNKMDEIAVRLPKIELSGILKQIKDLKLDSKIS